MPTAAAAPPKSAASSADEAFFRPAGQKVQANLEMLLGAAVVLKFESARRLTAEEARELVPDDAAVVVGGLGSGADGEALVAIERPLALILSCLLQMLPETAIKTRLGELAGGDLNDGERESVGEIGNFVVAALGERLRDLGGAALKLTQAPTRYLSGAGAVGRAEAVAAEGYLGAVGTMKAAGFDEYRVAVLLPDGIGKTAAPKAYEAPADAGAAPDAAAAKPAGTASPAGSAAPAAGRRAPAAGGGGAPAGAATVAGAPGVLRPAEGGAPVFDAAGLSIAITATDGAAERLAPLLPAGAEAVRVAGVGALLDAAEEGRAPALVVCEIPAGGEHRIDLLGLLRRRPAAARAAILVLLGRPVRGVVMRCAAAGLFDVLPSDADPETLRRRLEQLLRRAAG